jgi:hypothetical protein
MLHGKQHLQYELILQHRPSVHRCILTHVSAPADSAMSVLAWCMSLFLGLFANTCELMSSNSWPLRSYAVNRDRHGV